MKTRVEIRDALFREAKTYAAKHGVPIREVFERGLEFALRDSPRSGRRFRLKTVTTKGKGAAMMSDWSTIRPIIYEGHGG